MVEFETASDELTLSLSEAADLSSVGFLECQYIMLAVSVSIIFWFTWKNKEKALTAISHVELLMLIIEN